MMRVMYVAIPLLVIWLAISAVVTLGDATIVWNQTGIYVKLQPLTGEQSFEGLAFNAYYLNGSNSTYNVTLFAVKYISSCPYNTVEFTLYDFYNGTLIGNYTLNVSKVGNVVKEVVQVPSNITVVYVTMGSNVLGPYYISYMPVGVSLPSELKPYAPLIPLAFLIAMSARGRSKDVAFGLLAYAVTVIPICSAFGYENMLVPSLFSITAFLAFVALYIASHR